MTKLYVAYEDGVYRHSTIAVALSEDELYPSILEYFSKTDDYHSITVELLEAGKDIEPVSVYSIKSERVKVFHPDYSSNCRRHGKRVVYRDGVEYDSLHQEYKLMDGEYFAP